VNILLKEFNLLNLGKINLYKENHVLHEIIGTFSAISPILGAIHI